MKKVLLVLGLMGVFGIFFTPFCAVAHARQPVLRFSNPNYSKSTLNNPPEKKVVREKYLVADFVSKIGNVEKNHDDLEHKKYNVADFAVLDSKKEEVEAEEAEIEIIIDSDLSWEDAMINLKPEVPSEVIESLEMISVEYFGLDGKLHRGQVIIHADLVADIQEIFAFSREIQFPMAKVIPISQFGWSDDISMFENNSHGFDWRLATGLDWISHHGYGRAIDINPRQNPYYKNNIMLPANGTYDITDPGTLHANHPRVLKFKELGWQWGGDWRVPHDLHHFQKLE